MIQVQIGKAEQGGWAEVVREKQVRFCENKGELTKISRSEGKSQTRVPCESRPRCVPQKIRRQSAKYWCAGQGR